MKRLLFTLCFNFLYLMGYAQTDPKLSLFNFNPLVYNPAFAGSGGKLSVLGMHSSQFVGFDGAPQTQYFSIHSLFEAHKTGMGLDISNDKFGAVKTLDMNANFSYYLKLSRALNLAFGLKAGLKNVRIDYSGLNIYDPDEAIFLEGQLSQINPNLGFGTYLYSENFYLGLSVPNVIQAERFDPFKVSINSRWSNIYLISGYNLPLGQELSFKPNLLVRVVNGSPYSVLFSFLFEWETKGFAGLNYEVDTSLGGVAGFNLSEKLKVGYAFDHPTNGLGRYTKGTHSMFLSLNFEKFIKSSSIPGFHY